MTTDKYTKTVLTVIAVCLTVITLQSIDIIPKTYAGEGMPKLNSIDANTNYGLVPLNEDGSINVNIKSSEDIKVDLVKIDGYWVEQRSGKLRVSVD